MSVSTAAGGEGASGGWVTIGLAEGGPVAGQDRVLAAGLETHDEEILLTQAASSGGPVAFICHDASVVPVVSRPVLHFDLTFTCQENHPHVVLDPAALPAPTPPVSVLQELVTGSGDPSGTWKPPEAAPGDFASLIRDDMWTVLPVAAGAVWAAMAAGHGVREAMDWLSSGQLTQIAAYCRSLAGADPPPLVTMMESLAHGPAQARDDAVLAAWHALAPVEEVLRLTADAGLRADAFDPWGWLSSQALLLVTVPDPVSVSHQQMIKGLLNATDNVQFSAGRSGDQWTQATTVWHHVAKPVHWAWNNLTAGRGVVITSTGQMFAPWIGSTYGYDIVLGAHADVDALSAAGGVLNLQITKSAGAGYVIAIREPHIWTLRSPRAAFGLRG